MKQNVMEEIVSNWLNLKEYSPKGYFFIIELNL